MEEQDFDIKAEFEVRAYDRNCSSEPSWEFTQEHFDQGLIVNPDLVGKNYNLNNNFPFALRLSRFAPVQDHMIYTTRKLTEHPWNVIVKSEIEKNQMLYIPKTQEETFEHEPADASQKYRLRVTDMIGPKSNQLMDDHIHCFPESFDDLKSCTLEELEQNQIKSISWREYYNDGVLEGLRFTQKNGSESVYGESKRYGIQHTNEVTDQIKKIGVIYDDKWVTGLIFYNHKGEQFGKAIGKAKGNGAKGEVYQAFVGLSPQERIVGVRIQEARDIKDADAFVIGRISFVLSGPAPNGNHIHWSYSGQSVNYETATRYANQMGQLLTLKEAEEFIGERGALFPGEDQWAAVAEKNEWIQVGDLRHAPGKPHSQFGPPAWGPKENVFEWRNVFLWKDKPKSTAIEHPVARLSKEDFLKIVHDSVDQFAKNDFQELKAMAHPQAAVLRTCQAFMIILSGDTKTDHQWQDIRKHFTNLTGLIKELKQFDYTAVTNKTIKKAMKAAGQDFSPQEIARQAKCCEGLCIWILNVKQYVQYHDEPEESVDNSNLKKAEESQPKEKDFITINLEVEEEKLPFKKIVPKDLFLSTIKILRYFNDKDPELVKEILCESNFKPNLDYGPSVAIFQEQIYYFKRHLVEDKQYLQMWKYSFDTNQESKINGKVLEEQEDIETKIQFFEQPKTQNYGSEEEWLNNTYVSRQKILKETMSDKAPYQIYCLNNTNAAIYDSGDIKMCYLSKLVLLNQPEKLIVYIYTLKERFVFNIPKNEENIKLIHSHEDMQNSIKVRKNETDYHQDWPFEVRQCDIYLDNVPTTIDFFLVPCREIQVLVEILGLQDEEQEREAAIKVKQRISGGVFQMNKHQHVTTQIDRSYDRDLEVTFPAIIPRHFVKEIFDHKQQIDVNRKLYESPDGRALMLYCFAGREILVATLKVGSKYANVQSAFAALGYDPTPDDVKIKHLEEKIMKLVNDVQEQKRRIAVLEGRK